MPSSGTTTGWSRSPAMPTEASIPAPIKGAVNDKLGYEDLASLRWTRSGPAGMFRPVAQPQRHLESLQHQLGALVRGGGSADDLFRVDLHDESGVDDCGPGRPYLKPATWRRLGADTLKSEGCSPLLPGTVVRPGVTAQRPSDGAAVGGSAYKNPVHRTQPYCSSTPRGLRCQSPAATPRTVPGLWGEPDGLILELWLCRNNQQSAS